MAWEHKWRWWQRNTSSAWRNPLPTSAMLNIFIATVYLSAAFAQSAPDPTSGKCYLKNRPPVPVVEKVAPVPVVEKVVPKPVPAPVTAGYDPLGCVSPHNKARAAAGLKGLVWSTTLASSASAYARYLSGTRQFKHSGGPNGENLAKGMSKCASAVTMWIGERSAYGGQPIGQGSFSDYGHYTQIIDPSVKKVGCGGSGGVWVCHYDQIQTTGTRLTRY